MPKTELLHTSDENNTMIFHAMACAVLDRVSIEAAAKGLCRDCAQEYAAAHLLYNHLIDHHQRGGLDPYDVLERFSAKMREHLDVYMEPMGLKRRH